jgi:DNA-binding PadR family transcriptional regulator
MLRSRELTRYQIEELLSDIRPQPTEATVNKLLDSMWNRGLIIRLSVRYALTNRGQAALALIDQVRHVRRMHSAVDDEDGKDSHVPEELLRLMKRSPARGCASAADLRPAPARTGSLQFLQAPSRFGDRLHYRDGRVTDMAGTPL